MAVRRRTSFAAPVILTVAASCSSREAPGSSKRDLEAPRRTWTVTMANMKCVASQNAVNPPAPVQAIECPPGMSGATKPVVEQRGDGTCVVLPAGHVTACPLPPGKELVQKLTHVWTIEKSGAECHAEEEDHECPPGVDCNPPRPRTFPCPPGVTEDRPLHVAELPDATCVVVPDGCLDTGCAQGQVPCPPEGAR